MDIHKVVTATAAAILIVGSLAFADSIKAELAQEKAHSHMPVCAKGPKNDEPRCHSHVATDGNGSPQITVLPAGLGPTQFHAAYASETTAPSIGPKQIIAIVDAYDHPFAYNDLTVYSQTFGIPVLPQCTGPIAFSATPWTIAP